MIFQKKQLSSCIIICITILIICNKGFAQKISEYNIVQYGAIGDGENLNTEIIQKVIDMAHEKGGGEVIIPNGRFLTGTLQMKSNVELNLEKKAVLLGSTNPFDYKKIPMPGLPQSPKTDDLPQMALLVAYDAINISITGKGLVDGQGRDLALNIDSLHLNGIVIDPHYSVGANRPNYPIKGIEENYDKQRLIAKLEKGNKVDVILLRDGQEMPAKMVANPRMARLDFYDGNGQTLMVRKVEKQALDQTQKVEMTPQEVQKAAIARAAEQKQGETSATSQDAAKDQKQDQTQKAGVADDQKNNTAQRKKHGVHI